MSSGTLRGTSQTARADECEKITGASADAQRVGHRVRRHVAQVDEHPEPVHLAHDLLAERRQAAVCGRTSVAESAHGSVDVVGQRHVADAQA